jgi:hypothetical protein
MFKPLKEYFIALWADMLSRISGITSVLFLILGIVNNNFKTKWESQFWFWAFGLCYAIASFKVWYKNQPRLLIGFVFRKKGLIC